MKNDRSDQIFICKKYDAECHLVEEFQKVGVADGIGSGIFPINGLRHLPVGDTSGWYLWAGQDLGDDDDYFKAVHIFHLEDECPEIVKFLGLAPGWRFLVAPGHEDVWFDPSLLVE